MPPQRSFLTYENNQQFNIKVSKNVCQSTTQTTCNANVANPTGSGTWFMED
jgi:hypothetical protein